MEPNLIASLQALLAGGGNIGASGLVPPVVKPGVSGLPQGQATPSILPRNKAAGSPMDVRPPAAGGPGVVKPAGAPAAAAPPADGKKPSILDKVGRYGSAASAGMSSIGSDSSPLQAFGEALFGAMKGRRDAKAAEETTAYDRSWKEDERGYQRGRDAKTDARADAAAGRAAEEAAYRRQRDTIEDRQWLMKYDQDRRNDEFNNLKTAAEIEAERNGKPLSDKDVEEIIAKRYGGGTYATPEEVEAERARLKAIGRGPSIKDDSRAPGVDGGNLGMEGLGVGKGDRGGPSILPQGEPGITTMPKAAAPQQSQTSATVLQGDGTAKAPFKPATMQDLTAVAKPGDIFINPKDGKPYRYKGPPATP